MSSITLLGPQVRQPFLADVLRELRLTGTFAAVTAGWQEREGEIDELRAHIGAEVTDLGLYARAEQVYAGDAELRLAARRRQARLAEMQEIYRVRLGHGKRAARELFERDGDPDVLRPARRQAIAALRRLDRAHLAGIRRVRAQFDAELRPLERPAVRATLAVLSREIAEANAVFIAGGHVAVLLNRLRLFGGASLLQDKPVIAWSAGAMVACESVVLFHDHPPQGAGNAETFDEGLALARGLIVFPHARTRLRLHDATRIALLARRFAPARCVTLDEDSALHFRAGRLALHAHCWQLGRQGVLSEVEAA
ncbi:MAG TPA: Type 1 glutamine amidotransferase-like domain-containing protein [Steroidobacteraceae bacterium]|nr:Type 1 glutamine amidotransferase-like domain-containing protein [Steroidobacteraceae bacterium]